MKLSPIDIKHQDFKQALNGYNKTQVSDFLSRVAEMLEQKIEEIKNLRIELAERDQKIKDLEVSELELKKAAILAERIGNEAKAQAEREAELILREANAKSADILKVASDKERDVLNQAEDLMKEAEADKEALLSEAKVLQDNIKEEAELIKKGALKEAESLKEKALHEAEVQKRRTGRIIENLKKQVELEVKNIRQETIDDIADLREKGASQLKVLQDDIVGLDYMRQLFVEQLQTFLRGYDSKLEHFKKPIPSLLKAIDKPQSWHADEKGFKEDSQPSKNYFGVSVSPKLLEEIERRLSEQIQAVQTNSDKILSTEIEDKTDDIWAEELADDIKEL